MERWKGGGTGSGLNAPAVAEGSGLAGWTTARGDGSCVNRVGEARGTVVRLRSSCVARACWIWVWLRCALAGWRCRYPPTVL